MARSKAHRQLRRMIYTKPKPVVTRDRVVAGRPSGLTPKQKALRWMWQHRTAGGGYDAPIPRSVGDSQWHLDPQRPVKRHKVGGRGGYIYYQPSKNDHI